MEFELIEPVYSNFYKNGKREMKADKNTKVKIISDHYPAVIVEDNNGKKFSTNIKNIKPCK